MALVHSEPAFADDVLAFLAADFALMPPDAPEHIRRKVVAWTEREIQAGRVEPWLAARYAPDEWSRALAGELRQVAWLIGQSNARPDLRASTWEDVLTWTAAELDQVAPAWERRDVLHRFRDGWTIEQVATDRDLGLEGRWLRHCLDASRGRSHDAIVSLRDPAGRSRATLVIDGGEIVEVHGRGCSRVRRANGARVAEFALATGLELDVTDNCATD